jgi:hypothetical protein
MAKQRRQRAEEQVVVDATAAGRALAEQEAGAVEANGHSLAPSQRTDKRTFPSEADARAAGSQPGCDSKWKVWSVSGPGGTPVYLWASNFSMAMVRGGQHLGVTAVCVDKPAVSRDAVAAGLAAMSDEDRAVLIAQYLKQ